MPFSDSMLCATDSTASPGIWRVAARIPIAIAPVANHTGNEDLDAYRGALTYALIDELAGDEHVRVVPYASIFSQLTCGKPS